MSATRLVNLALASTIAAGRVVQKTVYRQLDRASFRSIQPRAEVLDEFTATRFTRYLSSFKKDHGRDVSHAELEKAGFQTADIDTAVRKGLLDKYQVTTGKGSTENRYKLHRDWRALRGN